MVVTGFTGFYSVSEVRTMAEVREALGKADHLNWLFVGTSGVHGSYTKLEEVFFEPWAGDPDEYDTGHVNDEVTVLVFQPRMVRSYYGHVKVTADDVDWLREQVRTTLRYVSESQEGNL